MVMNKFRNKSYTQAMKWGKMCIQNIPWNSTTIVTYWSKMLMLGEYQNIMIFCERPIKMAHCKNKIKIELWDVATIN
jgi:hypothetical protein